MTDSRFSIIGWQYKRIHGPSLCCLLGFLVPWQWVGALRMENIYIEIAEGAKRATLHILLYGPN